MIHFFAGAHKNGSHFQFYVLEEALRQRSIPYRVLGLDAFHAHDLGRSRELLAELRDTQETVLCKGHWYRRAERKLLLGQQNVKIYLIWRDMRDVLISSYHYRINKFSTGDSGFTAFYFDQGGRDLLIEQRLYRRAWSDKDVHETSYEALVDDFSKEAGRLLAFAGIDGVDLEALKAETTIGRLRETRGDDEGTFFRKGTTGQHRTFAFAPEVEADIEHVLAMGHPALLRERCLGLARRGIRKLSSKAGAVPKLSNS